MDIKQFCHSRGAIEKQYFINELQRFPVAVDEKDSSGYFAKITLKGGVDSEGRLILRGKMTAKVPQICQRCLQVFPCEREREINLSPVESDVEAKALPEELDPWLSETGELNPLAILEEELLLALPISPNHPLDDCKVKQQCWQFGDDEAPKQKNPFAALASLKRKH